MCKITSFSAFIFDSVHKDVLCQKFWKTANRLRKPKDTSLEKIPPKEVFEHFSKLLKPDKVDKVNVHSEEQGPLDFQITKEELELIMSILKARKSTGPDRISNEILEVVYEVFPNLILKIFNHIFRTGIYPKEWTISYLVPIHKKDSKLEIGNYRGICLMSCLGKAFSKILNTRLINWLAENNILSEEQLGFVKGNRTSDAHIILYNLFQKYCKNKKKAPLCLFY